MLAERFSEALCRCGGVVTSSDLVGRGASSGFFSIFCLRLSLLDGRAFALSSTSLVADRLAVGVLPRAVLELGAMLEDWCEPEAACDEFIEDDEFLGRAVTGGVVRFGFSMVMRRPRVLTSTQRKEQLCCGSRDACEARAASDGVWCFPHKRRRTARTCSAYVGDHHPSPNHSPPHW
jgi:hypothetical protein